MFNSILEKAAKAAKDVEKELAKSVTPISSPLSKAPSANDLAWLHRSPDLKHNDVGSLRSPKQKAGTGVGRSASWSNFADVFAPNSKTTSKTDNAFSGSQGKPNDGHGRAAELNAEKPDRSSKPNEMLENSPASRPRSRLGEKRLDAADESTLEERERQLDDAQAQIQIYEELMTKHNQDKITFQEQIVQLKARNAQLVAEIEKTREDSDIELALATSKYESSERMLESLKVRAKRKISLMQKEIDNLKREKTSGDINANNADNPSEDETSKTTTLITPCKTPSLSSLMSTVSLDDDNDAVREDSDTSLSHGDREIKYRRDEGEKAESSVDESLARPHSEVESNLNVIDRPTKFTSIAQEQMENPGTFSAAPEVIAPKNDDTFEGISEDTSKSNQKNPPTSPTPTSADRIVADEAPSIQQAYDALLRDRDTAVAQLRSLEKSYKEEKKRWHELENKQIAEDRIRESREASEIEETEKLVNAMMKRIEDLENDLKMEKEKTSRVLKDTAGSDKDGDTVKDDRNFMFEEQVKDLRFQLVSKQKEMAKTEESLKKTAADLEKAKTEHEEKMKRMKTIFTQANKTVNELRQQVAKKESEITGLKNKLDDFKEKESRSTLEMDESQRRADMLTTELRAQEVMFNNKLERLEARHRADTQRLSQVNMEFNQYKLRAHNLLQKNSSGSIEASKIAELKEALERAEQENRGKEYQLQESNDRIQQLQTALNEMHIHISDLEKRLEAAANVETQKISLENEKALLVEQLQSEQKAFKEAIENSKLVSANAIRKEIEHATADMEKLLHKKEEEHSALQSVTERLQEEFANVKKELENKVRELEELRREKIIAKRSTSQSSVTDRGEGGHADPGASGTSHLASSPVSSANESARKGIINATLEDLLASTRLPPHSATNPDLSSSFGAGISPRLSASGRSSSYKERDNQLQLQHMAELLNDSEATVQRLMDQEKLLKEEIRRLDRIDRRQDLNIEYLKNVLLKFVESTEREPLIPVLATVLHLSSEEVEKLKTSVASGGSSATPAASTGLLPWIL